MAQYDPPEDRPAAPHGSPGTRSESQRVAAGIVRSAAFPTLLMWGPDLIVHACSDAWRFLFGDREEAVGRPYLDVWAEHRDILAPQVAEALQGRTSFFQNASFTVWRDGCREERWFDYGFSPVHDDDGSIGGVLLTAIETTLRRAADDALRDSQARQQYLLRLDEALRPVTDPHQAKSLACALLGEVLGADQVAWADIDADGGHATVEDAWTGDRMPAFSGRCRIDDYGPACIADLKRGDTVAIGDVRRDSRTDVPVALESFAGRGIAGFVNVPLLSEGRLAAVLAVNSAEPRAWIEEEIALIRDTAERTRAAVERARAETALRESQQRLTLALDAGGAIGTWDWDVRADVVRADARLAALFGIDPGEAAAGVPLSVLVSSIHPDDRERTARAIRRAVETGGHFREEYRVPRADGNGERWMLARGRCLRDEGGQAARFPGVALDITERKHADVRQQLLMAELDHRVKNVLATVQSIARQSLRTIDREAADRFAGRLHALGQTHALLAEGRWEGASLQRLAWEAVAPVHSGDIGSRISLNGPELRLTPRAAQSLALALHELLTNASKYGALSTPAGKVAIDWLLSGNADGRRLVLSWRESGGPRIEARPARKGFGSTLIESTLAYELGGEVRMDYRPEGLRATVQLPLDALVIGSVPDDPRCQPEAGGGEFRIVDRGGLARKRIIVVEDQLLIAEEVADILRRAGCAVVGPVPTLKRALAMAASESIDAAVLDINLDGKMVWPVAERLRQRGIPFVFTSGYAAVVEPPPGIGTAPRVGKPIEEDQLVAAVTSLF